MTLNGILDTKKSEAKRYISVNKCYTLFCRADYCPPCQKKKILKIKREKESKKTDAMWNSKGDAWKETTA